MADTGKTSGTRDEPFSYVCHRCLRCCHHKLIRLNPYEIARLARSCGQTTSALQTESTITLDNIGVVLRQREADAACVFLGPEGCGVHPDRPLACRVYPLGRHVSEQGVETWTHVDPHPQTEGDYGTNGVIGDFIAGQETALYTEAADEYADWVRRAVRLVSGNIVDEHEISLESLAEITDLDTAIANHCDRENTPEPAEIEDRKRLHLSILHALVDKYEEETP
jgi:Fe-S-cluster containining protein